MDVSEHETDSQLFKLSEDILNNSNFREHMSKLIVTHGVKKSKRARSSEPSTESHDAISLHQSEIFEPDYTTQNLEEKTLSKVQDTMSKTELLSCYRLLMSEKLRLERFLSIVTKNNEMARNRLESDLLDAMMCIEDLKQALELRMARRTKVDPREAEERRYLIRQNKKLLSQLYESAKKIEKLELTKVEMKEQLELLDFQLLEVENQKCLLEEELHKLPPSEFVAVQTETCEFDDSQSLQELRQQVDSLKSELCHQKAESAAAVAKNQHLDNLVRELRRDNVELRDQLAKMDDPENSLAESDKPLANDAKTLQTQLNTQSELIRELQSKLKISRDYAEELESQLRAMESKMSPESPGDAVQAAMHEAQGNQSGLRVPRVDDLLLQETIRTFHALIAERDQELAQLRTFIRHKQAESNEDGVDSIVLPELLDSQVQTVLNLQTCNEFSTVLSTIQDGGLVLTGEQRAELSSELKKLLNAPTPLNDSLETMNSDEALDSELTFAQIISAVKRLKEHLIASRDTNVQTVSNDGSESCLAGPQPNQAEESREMLGYPMEIGNRYSGLELKSGKNERGPRLASIMQTGRPASAPTESSLEANQFRNARNPDYFTRQLRELKELGDLESIRAQLNVAEKRGQALENRVQELNEELARTRAEGRASEANLSAARRTEAALRRRLLVAMDAQGSAVNPSRYSIGATINNSGDTPNPVELEAALLKSEAINHSLTEAAQLDRARLHEQALNIGQLEADRRALHDRISALQASEAGAQRGIVRLQALYEDMLREYSESRSHEANTRRQRERSQSNYRNRDGLGQRTRSQNALQERISSLENENNELKRTVQLAQETKPPNGPCASPNCVMVRQLLQAFQARFSEVIRQLCETQSCLNKHGITMPSNSTVPTGDIDLGDYKCTELIQTVRLQLTSLNNRLKGMRVPDMVQPTLVSCSETLEKLERWLTIYLDQTDAEVLQLRQILLGVQAYQDTGEQIVETNCVDSTSQHPFSCSIRVNKKPNLNLLSQKESEIVQLRKHVRKLEAELQMNTTQ